MKGRRVSGLLNLENLASITVALFAIIVLSLPLIIGFTGVYADQGVQNVDIQVKVKMKNGDAAAYPRVQIYHLSEQGPRLIASGSGSQNGLYGWRITVPRVWGNRLYAPELKREIDMYAAANILILAYDEKTSTAGSLAVSVDPSFMKWPSDSFVTEVTLTDELPRAVEASSVEVLSLPPPPNQIWRLTNIVEYATWDQIWANASFPIGSKIDIESKQRAYDPLNNRYLTGWSSAGSTTITLDRGVGYPIITGKSKLTGIFNLSYILCYISIPNTFYYYETVYAVDTSMDPIRATSSQSSWSGSVSGSNPYVTGQNMPWTNIPITQASQWAFTITVSFGVSYPPGSVGISVSLGVVRYSIPYGRVMIRTGTWTQGYEVFTYGREYGFRRSYSVWKYIGPP